MAAATVLARLTGNRRNLVLGGAALAALALALATTLSGGGGEDPYASLGGASPPASTPSAALVAPAAPSTPSAPAPDHGHDDSGTAPLGDPFCPRVVAADAGVAAVTCPVQAAPAPSGEQAPAPSGVQEPAPSGVQPPAPSGQPLTLLAVFVEGGHAHARVQLGDVISVLHANDAFDVYTIASLAENCGDFVRGSDRRTLCVGEQWDGAPLPAPGP